MTPPRVPLRAVAALFVERQHLERPRTRRLDARTLTRFVGDVGGLQIDSINVLERAHALTVWSRFGAYDRARLERLLYRDRLFFEYWAHAACFVPAADLGAWRRAMLDYQVRHTGWSKFLRKHGPLLAAVEEEIRTRGPLGNSDFQRDTPRKGTGWWSWKPAAHALHYLWMTGRILVDSRLHFQKRFHAAERVLPAIADLPALDASEFVRWHLRRSLHAMGAATEADLRMYLTFPRMALGARKKALQEMVHAGEVAELRVDAADGRERTVRWFALAEDLPALAAAGRRRRAATGTTFLAPFDSFLWYRDRTRRLFGFDYRIEVYTPGPKRVHGYYVLPIWHDGQLVGRLDAKNHRNERRLELRRLHLEPWVVKGGEPPAASWGRIDPETALTGIASAAHSLASHLGAERITIGKVTPGAFARPLRKALREVDAGEALEVGVGLR